MYENKSQKLFRVGRTQDTKIVGEIAVPDIPYYFCTNTYCVPVYRDIYGNYI